MTLNFRTRILLIIGLLVVICGLVFILARFWKKNNNQSGLPNIVKEDTVVQPEGLVVNEVKEPTVTLSTTELSVRQTATLVLERWGSFSNRNDGVNVKDALPFVTESMAKWMKTQTKESGVFTGQTVEVLSLKIVSLDETAAELEGQTRRTRETLTEKNVVYQTAKINLVKNDEGWKVDGIFWLK